MSRRTATKTVPISEARRRLFEIADDVLTGRAHRVALSHRGRDEQLVLVRARELEKIEAELADLRARVEPAPWSPRGKLKLLVSVDEFDRRFAENRAHQAELAAAKLASIVAPFEPNDSDGADDADEITGPLAVNTRA